MSTKIWLKVMGKMTIIDHPLIHWMWEIHASPRLMSGCELLRPAWLGPRQRVPRISVLKTGRIININQQSKALGPEGVWLSQQRSMIRWQFQAHNVIISGTHNAEESLSRYTVSCGNSVCSKAALRSRIDLVRRQVALSTICSPGLAPSYHVSSCLIKSHQVLPLPGFCSLSPFLFRLNPAISPYCEPLSITA
jgi:hypothetical protein